MSAPASAGLALLQREGLDLAALRGSSVCEVLEWHIPRPGAMPDAEMTMLLKLADGEVWQGYFDGEQWRDVQGMPIAQPVRFWCDPAGPEL